MNTESNNSKGLNILISVLVALLAVMVPLTVLKACGGESESAAEVGKNDEAEAMAKAMQIVKDYHARESMKKAMEELGRSNEAYQARLEKIQDDYEKRVSELDLARQLREIQLQKLNVEAEADIAEIEAGVEREGE